MKRKGFLFSMLIFASFAALMAQKQVNLQISHYNKSEKFNLGDKIVNNYGNEFTISRLDYYLSNFVIYHDGGKEIVIPDSYLLVRKGGDATFNLGNHNLTTIDSISYLVGVDSINNHADPALRPMDHPLGLGAQDMHWGWTGGYRFIAMEGKNGTSLNKSYQVHCLWDHITRRGVIKVGDLPSTNEINVPVIADVSKAADNIDMTQSIFEHGDTKEPSTLVKNFAANVFKMAGITSTVDKEFSNIKIYPQPFDDVIFIDGLGDIDSEIQCTIFDANGRQVYSSKYTPNGIQPALNTGNYLIKLDINNKTVFSSSLIRL